MDKPVIIYSMVYFNKRPILKKTHNKYLEFIRMSNEYTKYLGYKTVLYTDKYGEEVFKDIPFSEVKKFDDETIKKLPTIWSIGKLLAMSLETRPFFHIDLDFMFLSDKFLKKIKNESKIIYFHQDLSNTDKWIRQNQKNNPHHINKLAIQVLPFFNIDIDKEYFDNFNMAIFGSHDTNQIKIINDTAKMLINKITYIYNNNLIEWDYWIMGNTAIFLEQILFILLLKKQNCEFEPILNINMNLKNQKKLYSETVLKMLTKGFIHLWILKNPLLSHPKTLEVIKNVINKFKK